ncbi:MAG: YidC/Oxa1 family membrane protein insertase [Patescibacteria group bacterium]|nr:YidC/Oxa1 family membrane protein insertase [Patescibacteria group bacterium]
MLTLWNTLLYQPLLQALIFLYKITGSFGLAVLVLTVLIRAVLVPITIPALKSAKKMAELKPHLDALKNKHGSDKQRLQAEQLKLYREHGVNPAAGCLPYLVQFLVLIALYQVFIFFLQHGRVDGLVVNMKFFWMDLAKPDHTYILPVFAGLTQLVLSVMMVPVQKTDNRKQTTENKEQKEKKEADMAEQMQKQMLFLMPAMTVFIGISLPSGLALYWVATTVFSLVQQYFVTGLGGLETYLAKLKNLKQRV